jgi:hypothetical protein
MQATAMDVDAYLRNQARLSALYIAERMAAASGDKQIAHDLYMTRHVGMSWGTSRFFQLLGMALLAYAEWKSESLFIMSLGIMSLLLAVLGFSDCRRRARVRAWAADYGINLPI